MAGAWIAPEGGQEIWTNGLGARDQAAVFETAGLWEAPLSERASFVATGWFEEAYDNPDGQRAEIAAGAKLVLARSERGVMAVQASALWRDEPEAASCGEGGFEARWLGGQSFGETGFFNIEAAARAQDGGCADNKLDITAGYRPRANWLALGQVFVDAPDRGEESVKFQLSLVRFSEDGEGVQLGVRTRLDGHQQETMLVLAFWDDGRD